MSDSMSDSSRRPRPLRAAALALGLLAATAGVAAAQGADAVLRDFQLTGDYVLLVGGEEAPDAEIYLSERVPAYLIVADQLASPALLLPREGAVRTVSFMKLAKRGGTIDILADAELASAGSFRLAGETIGFSVGGTRAVLKPRPHLLGRQDLAGMLDYSPEYRRTAAAYSPDARTVSALKAVGKPVKVRIYFGSWCSFCKQYVPKLLKVAEQLEGSRVAFEFYGLPQGFAGEPMAERDDVHAVPTGIVYVGGKEVGRLRSQDWQTPEKSLRQLVLGT